MFLIRSTNNMLSSYTIHSYSESVFPTDKALLTDEEQINRYEK